MVLREIGEFFGSDSGRSGMNYRQRNRALFECIRERCVRTGRNQNGYYVHDAVINANLVFYVRSLFLRYAPLCMSSHDAVADDSCSDLLENIPRLLNY